MLVKRFFRKTASLLKLKTSKVKEKVKSFFKRRPLVAVSTASAGMQAIGDYICQIGIEGGKRRGEKYKDSPWYVPDPERTLKMASVAFLLSAPMSYLLYTKINPWYVNKVIPKIIPKFNEKMTRTKRAFTGVVVDVGIFS